MKPLFTVPRSKRSRNHFSASSLPDWSNLPSDILGCVIIRMPCFDIIRFKHVCRSWKKAVLDSCLISSSNTPYLILSTTDNRGCCFFNLAHQKLQRQFNNFWGDLDIYCIGCSEGRLILHVADEESQSSVFIFNPFRFEARKIVIPSDTPPEFRVNRKAYRTLLTADPIHSGGKFGVIFQISGEVTLLMQDSYHPENNKWIEFPLSFFFAATYSRGCIISLGNFDKVSVYKLALTTNGSLHLSKKEIFKASFEQERDIFSRPWSPDGFSIYMVESEGGILLVTRIMETLVENGRGVHTTKHFDVFKYSLHRKRWLKVDSLGDRVLFLGGNHSLSLSLLDVQGCQGNSIYFTDHISTISNKTGGDTGVFSLEDGSIKQLIWNESKRINQRTIWLV